MSLIYGSQRVICGCLRLTTIWRSVRNRKKNPYNYTYVHAVSLERLGQGARGQSVHFSRYIVTLHNCLYIYSCDTVHMMSTNLCTYGADLKPIQGFCWPNFATGHLTSSVPNAHKIHISIYRNCSEVWKCSGLSFRILIGPCSDI